MEFAFNHKILRRLNYHSKDSPYIREVITHFNENYILYVNHFIENENFVSFYTPFFFNIINFGSNESFLLFMSKISYEVGIEDYLFFFLMMVWIKILSSKKSKRYPILLKRRMVVD